MSSNVSSEQKEVREAGGDDYDKHIVHVEAIERGREEDTGNTKHVGMVDNKPELHSHESETLKTTYTVEEDPPTFYQKMKGKILAAEYQVKSMVADYTKKANPQPVKSTSSSTKPTEQISNFFSDMKKNMLGGKQAEKKVKEDVEGLKDEKMEAKYIDKSNSDDESDRYERYVSSKENFDSATTEDKKVQAGEELGTGYESGSEESGASQSEDNACSNVLASLPKQSETMFKPAKAQDKRDVVSEELQSSKLNQSSTAEDIKAPGVLTRMKEEVDAITEQVVENLGMKGK